MMSHRAVGTCVAVLLVAGCGGSVSTTSTGEPTGTPTPVGAGGPGTARPPASVTAPATVEIDAEGDVLALTTTPTSVCWSSFATTSTRASLVGCARKSDGKRADLLRDTLVHPAIAASGDDLYWSTEVTASIDHAPLAGGAVSPFVTTKGPHGRFVVARGTFYWMVDAGASDTRLLSATRATAAFPLEVAKLGWSDTELLAVVDYTVYDYPVALSFANGVQRVHAGGDGAPEQVSGNCFYPVDLAADSDHTFWSCEDNTLRWASWRGGEEHIERDTGFGTIAVWQGDAYVTDAGGGRVLRLRPLEGKLDVVRTGLYRPSHVAVDASGIYVAEGRTIRWYALP